MKKRIAILLVVLMMLTLIACGGKCGNSAEASIVGTWELVDGEGDAKETVAMMMSMGMTMSFTFNADGTGSMTYVFSGDSASESFDYTLENGQIVIDGAGADYTLDGDRLTIEVEGYVLVFERQ